MQFTVFSRWTRNNEKVGQGPKRSKAITYYPTFDTLRYLTTHILAPYTDIYHPSFMTDFVL